MHPAGRIITALALAIVPLGTARPGHAHISWRGGSSLQPVSGTRPDTDIYRAAAPDRHELTGSFSSTLGAPTTVPTGATPTGAPPTGARSESPPAATPPVETPPFDTSIDDSPPAAPGVDPWPWVAAAIAGLAVVGAAVAAVRSRRAR